MKKDINCQCFCFRKGTCLHFGLSFFFIFPSGISYFLHKPFLHLEDSRWGNKVTKKKQKNSALRHYDNSLCNLNIYRLQVFERLNPK